jgi:hypothetical protein
MMRVIIRWKSHLLYTLRPSVARTST